MNKKGFLPLIVLIPLIIIAVIIIMVVLKVAIKIIIYLLIGIGILFVISWLLRLKSIEPVNSVADSCKTRFTDEEDIKKCERGEL